MSTTQRHDSERHSGTARADLGESAASPRAVSNAGHSRERLHRRALLTVLSTWLLLWGLVDLPEQWSIAGVTVSALRTTLLVVLLALLTAVRPPWTLLRWWPFAAFSGLVVGGIALVVATGHARDHYGQQQSTVYVEYLLLFSLVATAAWTSSELRLLLRFALAAVIIADILEVAVLIMHGVNGNGIVGARPFASFAVVGTAVAVGCRSWRPRLAWPLALAQLALIGLSQSRAAFFASLLIISLVLLAEAKRRGRRSIIAVVVTAWGIIVYSCFQVEAIRERFFFHGSGGGRLPALNTQGRDTYWRMTWDYAGSSPLFGHGVGSSSDLIANYTSSNGITFIEHPHNDYLRILADGGAIAIAIVVLAAAWILYTVIRQPAMSQNGQPRSASAATAIFRSAAGWSCLGMSLMMVTGNALVIDFVMAPTVAILGIALGGGYIKRAGGVPRTHGQAISFPFQPSAGTDP